MKVMAYVHSLKDKKTDTNVLSEVEILEIKDNNNVIALYNGVKCRGIFNYFVGRYYIDDVYRRLDNDK